MKRILLSLLMIVTIAFAYFPSIVVAEEEQSYTVEYPDATVNVYISDFHYDMYGMYHPTLADGDDIRVSYGDNYESYLFPISDEDINYEYESDGSIVYIIVYKVSDKAEYDYVFYDKIPLGPEAIDMSFEPNSITVPAAVLLDTDQTGKAYYNLYNRSVIKPLRHPSWTDFFALGDKIKITKSDGTIDEYTFTLNEMSDNICTSFETAEGSCLVPEPELVYDELKVGNNKITINYADITTSVNLIITEPEQDSSQNQDTDKNRAEEANAAAADLAKTAPNTVHAVGGNTVQVLTNVSGAVPGTVAFTKAKNTKSVTVPATVVINGKTFNVTQINANAFKGSKIRTVTIGKNVKVIKKNAFKGSKVTKLIVKTKSLKKAKIKGCLKGSKVKTIQVKVGSKKQNKKYVKSYEKIFTKKNAGKKATVK